MDQREHECPHGYRQHHRCFDGWTRVRVSRTHFWSGRSDRSDIPLRFLVHFVGDMHQPLHLTGRDRGGNGGERVLTEAIVETKASHVFV